MATLADAVNVRENTMSVLSAGINEILRTEYPAPMGVAVALMLEIAPSDPADAIVIDVEVLRVPQSVDEKPVVGVRGELNVSAPRTAVVYAPIPFDFRGQLVPSAGNYEVAVRVADLDPVKLTFTAHQIENATEAGDPEPGRPSE